ncbi:hypothetical protein KA005_72525, partial [bacterium]|nr:hypothetical protein [bacterium]
DIDGDDAPDPAIDPNDVWIAGDVGIGTTGPTTKLHVVGPGSGAGGAPTFRMVGDYMTVEDLSSEIWFVDTNDNRYWKIHNTEGYFDFDYTSDNGANWANKIRFDENGYVGIGTMNPEVPLHVVGDDGILVDGDGGSSEIRFKHPPSVPPHDDWVAKVWDGRFNIGYGDLSTASWTYAIAMKDNGNVGVGTIDPTATLHVNGNIKAVLNDIDGASPANMRYNSGTDEIGYDIAEIFEANEEVEPADVLCIGEDGKLRKSNKEYDTTVAGIVSAAPAILFEGSQLQIAPQPFMFQKGKRLPLALVGRVSCNVTTENGPINCGDLLVTSSKPGYAMKANPDRLKPGMILAKALEPLEEGEAKIMVLIK